MLRWGPRTTAQEVASQIAVGPDEAKFIQPSDPKLFSKSGPLETTETKTKNNFSGGTMDSALALHPVAPDSIPGIPKKFS